MQEFLLIQSVTSLHLSKAHMEKSVEIPQDIIYNIIAAVGDDKRLLKQCSLVSSSFLLPSRKQLFSRITLRSDKTCQGIHQLLVQNPVIQSCVRAITLTEYISDWDSGNPTWMNSTSLLAILRLPFGCLECFSINVSESYWDAKPWNWNNFSGELKDALSNIIHSSNLKTLSLEGVTRVPITFFLHIVHLSTLELNSVSPDDFCNENSNSLTRAASMVVAPMASQVVIDRCEWYLKEYSEFGSNHASGTRFPSSAYFSLIQDREGPSESIFLPFVCRLRFFEIDVDLGPATMYDFNILSFLMGSLCISLTSPATLEHLKFDISFRGNNNYFECYTFYEGLRDADVWSHLDSITTRSIGSRLQRVDINIIYSYLYENNRDEPHEHEVLKAVLGGLPLLRTKDILFVAVSGNYCVRYPVNTVF